jgi:hypothetical protein
MAIDTTALNKLITDFRALSQKDSVSPESLGSLLQKLADQLASCPADSEVNNALNSVNRNITSLQSDLLNIERSAVTADELKKALSGKADDFAYYVDTDTIEFRSGTLKVASQQIAMAIADIVNGNKLRDNNIEAKADSTELHVVLESMGVTLDNLDSTGDSAIMYVANVGDIYYSEGKEHLFFKKSETETIDLGEPNDKKIYANAMTKRLYIWRGGKWQQCGGGGTQIDAYTKAESDARFLRGGFEYCGLMEWDGKNEVKIYEMKFDSPKREVFIFGQCKWDKTNRGEFKIIITNEKYPSGPYGISYFSSSSNSEECFHIHNVCGTYVCDINASNNHLVPNALKRCYMRDPLTDQRHEDVGLITNLKIEITTDLVRIDGVQKWYVFGK